MCGISCCIALSGSKVPPLQHLQKQLDESLDIIKHRGPDSKGQWISKDARPFHSPDGKIHAVVNGELYGHEEIRAQLGKHKDFSYQFQGTSDSEIVIALYQYYGLNFLEHLRGEFALCLWDEEEQLFLAARDRYGIKPLFYTVDDSGRLLIAAEIKAFLPMGWKAKWDVRSIKDGGWNFDDRTHFRGVSKIFAGHYFLCRSYSRHFEQRPYWDMTYPDKTLRETRSEKEMIQGVQDHLVESIRLRLRADVPVGVYLSGGIDSSAVAGIINHLIRERGAQVGNDKESNHLLSCFSIAFDEDSGFDESTIASRTADFLGVKLYKKHMSEAELAKRFEDATWHCEHINFDLNYIGKFALSELPRELGFKVVLTGEGSDEHFAGYPLYQADYLREPDSSWPETDQAPSTFRQDLCLKMDEQTEEYYESIGATGSKRFEPESIISRRMLNNITTHCSMAAFHPEMLFAPWTSSLGACNPRTSIANGLSGQARAAINSKWHPVHSAMYVWTKCHLSNVFLSCLGDRTEMAHSIEARTPFLDHHLTEYINSLPPSMKIRYQPPSGSDETSDNSSSDKGQFLEKYALREAAKPFITEEIYTRTKQPYLAPTTYPANGPLHKLLERLITREAVENLGFVSWPATEHLLTDAFDKKDTLAIRLCFYVAQWIVLAQRFGVPPATKEEWV